jgi:thiamine-monophosphate kinase
MELTKLAAGPEFDLIRAVAAQASLNHPLVRVGPGDDCALIGDLAISTDASVENVHFRRAWLTPEEIGGRAVGAALSDLAAVAAEPVGVLITLITPPADRGDFVLSIMRGAIAAAESVGAALLGGDTTAGDVLTLDVVAVGRTGEPVLRSGARPGDEVWVTGALGGAAAAVAAWQRAAAPNAAARARYARVQPRILAARVLLQQVRPTALIDISDGLYGDAAHLAAASDCSIVIDAGAVPVDVAAGATFQDAVSGGEDYELCFTAVAGTVEPLRARLEAELDMPLTRVGSVATGSGVMERAADGTTRAVERGGYQHFKDGAR